MKVLLTFLFYTTICNGAKILGVFNHPGTSHTLLGKVLLKNLAQKGHEIVMISAFPMEEPIQNYTDIFLPEILEDLTPHPNVKLFITHGGMLSLIEAINYEVPLICLPFFGDQFTNAAFIETRKIGRFLSSDNITEEGLFNMIQEVLTNPQYRQNIGFRSSLLREQAVRPMDSAIYWIEHVIKYREANHLKPFATKLPWYKYYLVDVIVFLSSVLLILTKGIVYMLKKINILFRSMLKKKID